VVLVDPDAVEAEGIGSGKEIELSLHEGSL
jgi:hypothetical protein